MKFLYVFVFLVAVGLTFADDEAKEQKEKPNRTPPTKLQIGKVLKTCEKGSTKTKKGDKLSMHYTGRLHKDDTKFDSSLDRGTPFEFTLGAGQVIQGWDQGLVGMCVGEKRRLHIPADLGYGDRGAGAKIPGGAALLFDVELLKINGVGAKKDEEKNEL